MCVSSVSVPSAVPENVILPFGFHFHGGCKPLPSWMTKLSHLHHLMTFKYGEHLFIFGKHPQLNYHTTGERSRITASFTSQGCNRLKYIKLRY